MDELRNTLETELMDTDAEEPSPDEDLSTELRGIKLTDDDDEPNVSATVGVQDRIRFSHHLGKVKLQDPARPRLNPVDAGRPTPKKKKSPGPKSPDRMRTMMLAASFRSAHQMNFENPEIVAKAVCDLRPDKIFFHGEWQSTEGRKESEVFLDNFNKAFEVAQKFIADVAGLNIVSISSCKPWGIAEERARTDVDYAMAFTHQQLNAFFKCKPRAINKTGGQTCCAVCGTCLHQLSKPKALTLSATEFIHRWKMCVIAVFKNHRTTNPDNHSKTVRFTLEMKELYFHDHECD